MFDHSKGLVEKNNQLSLRTTDYTDSLQYIEKNESLHWCSVGELGCAIHRLLISIPSKRMEGDEMAKMLYIALSSMLMFHFHFLNCNIVVLVISMWS